MTTNQFSVIDSIKQGWANVYGAKATMWALFILIVIAELIRSLMGHASEHMGTLTVIPILFIWIFIIILQSLLTWAVMYFGILRARNLPIRASMASYVWDFRFFWNMVGLYILEFLILSIPLFMMSFPAMYLASSHTATDLSTVEAVAAAATTGPSLLTSIICGLIIIVGFILTIFLSMRLYVAKLVAIDEKTGPYTAIQKSFAATKSHVWQLVGLTILNMLILLVSIIPLGIGLIWSMPYLFVNYGIVYTTLTSKKQ